MERLSQIEWVKNMTNFIDLIYCSGLDDLQILAYAPMNEFIKKGDIVRIDGMTGFYMVTCHASVSKDSDTYKFITEALGDKCDGMHKVTDKYSHKEIEGSEDE